MKAKLKLSNAKLFYKNLRKFVNIEKKINIYFL